MIRAHFLLAAGGSGSVATACFGEAPAWNCADNAELRRGPLLLFNNVWNKGSLDDYEQCIALGEDAFHWRWRWPGGWPGRIGPTFPGPGSAFARLAINRLRRRACLGRVASAIFSLRMRRISLTASRVLSGFFSGTGSKTPGTQMRGMPLAMGRIGPSKFLRGSMSWKAGSVS